MKTPRRPAHSGQKLDLCFVVQTWNMQQAAAEVAPNCLKAVIMNDEPGSRAEAGLAFDVMFGGGAGVSLAGPLLELCRGWVRLHASWLSWGLPVKCWAIAGYSSFIKLLIGTLSTRLSVSIPVVHGKIGHLRRMRFWMFFVSRKTLSNVHEIHETCHSVTFIVLVNSHQR